MLDRNTGEVLLILAELSTAENGQQRAVFIRDAADRMGMQPAVLARTVQNLDRQGLAVLQRFGYAAVTEKGMAAAEEILGRRKTIECFLSRITGRASVREESARIEYLLEDDTVAALERMLTAETAMADEADLSSARIQYEKRHTGEAMCIDMP